MDHVTQQRTRVQAAIASGTLTKAELARKAGISDTVLIGMEKPDWNPRFKTLSALVRVCDEVGFKFRRLRRGGDQAAA